MEVNWVANNLICHLVLFLLVCTMVTSVKGGFIEHISHAIPREVNRYFQAHQINCEMTKSLNKGKVDLLESLLCLCDPF